MKTRSEIMAEKNKKTSAAERTQDMFEKKSETKEESSPSTNSVSITCPGCEEEVPVDKLEKTKKGYECPHCAQPIDLTSSSKTKHPPNEVKKPEEGIKTRSGSFCGECGAEWPVNPDGSFVISCGHGRALRVDDPRKATNMKSTTASGVTTPPDKPVETKTVPTELQMNPTVKIEGNRLTVGWPEIKLPVGEEHGYKYSDMKVPSSFISVELPPNADRVAEARKIIAELQKIADLSFDVAYKWYREKLSLVTKD